MKHIKNINERSEKITTLFIVAASFVMLVALGFFINNALDLQAVASNPGHNASSVSPGTFDGGGGGTFTFPGSIKLGGVARNTWPSGAAGGDSDWTISGNDMYSAVTGNVKIDGNTNPANPNNARLLVNSGAYGIEATGTTGVYSYGTSTGYWGGSTTGNGMYATSSSGTGVWGGSLSGNGVVGTSNTASGVYGQSTTGYSGYFTGGNGVKVVGDIEATDLVLESGSGGGITFEDGTYQDTAAAGGGISASSVWVQKSKIFGGGCHTSLAWKTYASHTVGPLGGRLGTSEIIPEHPHVFCVSGKRILVNGVVQASSAYRVDIPLPANALVEIQSQCQATVPCHIVYSITGKIGLWDF